MAYKEAQEYYARLGSDTEEALKRLANIPISIHCWQGDDVGGFEGARALEGGIQATGSYAGKAQTPVQLREDLDKAFSLIPGRKRLNLHACYAESYGAPRDQLTIDHFAGWLDWSQRTQTALDFNPTLFSHPLAADGLTLSHPDKKIRDFWVRHAIACRKIAAEFGRRQKSPCINNLWAPDGYKDNVVDKTGPRQRLLESLDEIFALSLSKEHILDSVESKLFGIGSEAYVAGSHEFYMAYALKNNTLLTLDAGHFHPTESIAQKISSLLLFMPKLLLHVSRPVRWDSDHVVILDDETLEIGKEIARLGQDGRVLVGLDFFDASINRIAAWVVGSRSMQKALLLGLLEPTAQLAEAERQGRFTCRLALLEELKSAPWPAVWQEYCRRQGVPEGMAWLKEVEIYETSVLSKRGKA